MCWAQSTSSLRCGTLERMIHFNVPRGTFYGQRFGRLSLRWGAWRRRTVTRNRTGWAGLRLGGTRPGCAWRRCRGRGRDGFAEEGGLLFQDSARVTWISERRRAMGRQGTRPCCRGTKKLGSRSWRLWVDVPRGTCDVIRWSRSTFKIIGDSPLHARYHCSDIFIELIHFRCAGSALRESTPEFDESEGQRCRSIEGSPSR